MPAPVIMLTPLVLQTIRASVDYITARSEMEARRQQFALELRAMELDREVERFRIESQREVLMGLQTLARHAFDRNMDGLLHVFDRTHEALVESRRAVDEQLNSIAEMRYRGSPNAMQMAEMGHRERELQRNREQLDGMVRGIGDEFGRLIAHLRLQGPASQMAAAIQGRIQNDR
ncbi:hypothetical protein [Falsiroseomonas stagni]|uniref:Uncharacterized protein n=1 Tax=Falsiroseomonas stagni DSM 19981 TaxID=1123062 RepID=A0A1I4FBX7_9PROT|nr:hypothetical protein [Falsiroseomonas stagni]SFL13891.1 hypothetical protein SAMN02745775_12511 [Falsiroseomonas stagni DSM 19981]